MQLAKDTSIHLVGINQRDKAGENAIRFLSGRGNPYSAVGADADGRASIEWGVTGVPETFVINARGEIVYRHVGAIGPDLLATQIAQARQR